MVLPNLFHKSPRKKKDVKVKTVHQHHDDDDDDDDAAAAAAPLDLASAASPASSSRSSPTREPRSRLTPSSPKTRSKKSRTAQQLAWDSHPLNLPPDQLKRWSVMSAMSSSTRMDLDLDLDLDQEAESSPSPSPASPTAHPSSSTNGANGDTSPVPPPHKIPTKSTPPPSAPALPPPAPAPPTVDPESFKQAGNRFFAAKQYARAIAEYTKGTSA